MVVHIVQPLDAVIHSKNADRYIFSDFPQTKGGMYIS